MMEYNQEAYNLWLFFSLLYQEACGILGPGYGI